jgi:hypothetical protein
MKKFIFFLALSLGLFTNGFAQFEYVSGSLKYGSLSNSIMLTMKSNTTFTANFSNVQFMVQIPNTVTPQPTATILNNPLNIALNSATFQTQVTNENGFYNYLFSAIAIGAPSFTFTAGTEYNALEIKFADGPAGLFSDVRLGHLPDGGSTSQLAFYIELGTDYTNYTNMFYGTGVSNGGSYSSYSYVPLSNILLPVNFTDFTVTKSKNDAILDWKVDGQTANTATYQIERSTDAIQFSTIGSVNAKPSASKASYQYNDVNALTTVEQGNIYYRIKQIDRDGKFSYSSVRSVRVVPTPIQMGAFPNPVRDLTKIQFDFKGQRNINFTLADMNGKVLQTITFKAKPGQNTMDLNLGNYASGTYKLTLKDGPTTSHISLNKQ